ncbi:MAG TPA: hypothetical protein VHK90_01485 [Thermoanaerobaculia bacterium]|nr:hypothetical protein [Thermoanaerobaculia bacterium]
MKKLFLLLLLAIGLRAQTTDSAVYVVPAGPDSATPVEIVASLWCEPGPATVTILGKVIKVHFAASGQLCGDPPFLLPYRAKVPSLLAPGQYRVEVTYGATDAVVASTSFAVRDADPLYEVHPFVVEMNPGDTEVRIYDGIQSCVPQSCAIRVGDGALLTPRVDGDDIVFDAPPGNAGVHDVTMVRNQGGDVTLPAALAYVNFNASPDLSIFERILFPVLSKTPGANGSDWRTELAVSNPRPWVIETYNFIERPVFPCVEGPCADRLTPGRFLRFSGGTFPNGHALLVPRNEAEDVAFSLRVRDVSRVAEGFGTEIPVVRERELYRNVELTLLDVPLDPRYRAKLRLYAFDPFLTNAGPGAVITIVRANGARSEVHVPLARTCAPKECPSTPMYAAYDFPAGTEGERVDVYVAMPPEALTWGFVSVTNNTTQQVTIVTPAGSGGEPCHDEQSCSERGH